MPKRNDIQSILIIGAGPIIIGQACEFDYSGVQACRALKQEGFRVILVNSNPATIMTDPEIGDTTYIEPVEWHSIAQIIEKEQPDALLPTMGGQTALNCSRDLVRNGVLQKHGVELIGANEHAIELAEDRQRFRNAMEDIGLECARSYIVHTVQEAEEAYQQLGLPLIIRPSFTLGGSGGGIAYSKDELHDIVQHGLHISPTKEVLIEESLLGWKEFEMEVVRDQEDNCIIICSIENMDPMGVHTGDSITVAPAQTLTDKEYQKMRAASMNILRRIGVETGGSNVQFAIEPHTGRMVVIEMNPRVSRSSALASKATGFPIAKVAARLAVGYTLYELRNEITGNRIPASFEPTIDYVVTKIPRFTFEKFPEAADELNTQMKSIGEVMALGRTFKESLQKAARSLETGMDGLTPLNDTTSTEKAKRNLAKPQSLRLWHIADAFRAGLSMDEIYQLTSIDRWFLSQIQELIITEETLQGLPLEHISAAQMYALKRDGFSDSRLSNLLHTSEQAVRKHRHALNIRPVYKRVDSCAAEFDTSTAYLYSTYEEECEAVPSNKRKIIILGGGPNRIGQGIEFDYCCVHAVFALHEAGFETIMINCNPETVSTDYDISDRLYFEPLTIEDVYEIIDKEQPAGIILQLGGQTPLKLARELEEMGAPIIGTPPQSIDLAEDRDQFRTLIEKLHLRQPANAIAATIEDALAEAQHITYPLVVRPSYVLGGRAMAIVHNDEELTNYMRHAIHASKNTPILLDHFLSEAVEVDVDILSDGTNTLIGGIMEHIEWAGIHSGDSACSLPPCSLSMHIQKELSRQARELAAALNVQGLMNIQFAVQENTIYIIEVNPRASRTIPFVSKATAVPLAKIAARCMVGEKLTRIVPALISSDLSMPAHSFFAVKESVFPFIKFENVNPILGPEMKSTGEVMGIAENFGEAFLKAQIAAGHRPVSTGTALLITDNHTDIITIARALMTLGFSLMTTPHTATVLEGMPCTMYDIHNKGSDYIVELIRNGAITLIVHTVHTSNTEHLQQDIAIRRAAVKHNTFYTTTIAGAHAVIEALHHTESSTVLSLHDINPVT